MNETMHETIREWLCAREVLRRLGFSADELFFSVYTSGQAIEGGRVIDVDMPFITLEIVRPDKKFTWTIGAVKGTRDEIQAVYEAACEAWNNGGGPSHAEFIASRPVRQATNLIGALRRKGFAITGNLRAF